MQERIVIYEGVFNPPTMNDRQILLTAMQAAEAEKGVFLPRPFEAVKAAVSEENRRSVMNNRLRRVLLESLADDRDDLSIEQLGFDGDDKGLSPRMLGMILAKHKEESVFIVASLRELYLLPKQPERDALIERLGYAIMLLPGQDAEKAFEKNEWLRVHRDRFVIFRKPVGTGDIEENEMIARIRGGDETMRPLVGEKGWQILTEYGWISGNRIGYFRNDYDFLSNFYPAELEYEGIRYQNSEAAFQAQKCICHELRKQFAKVDALEAKRLGQWVMLREEWEDVKLDVMRSVLCAKFTQNPELMEALLATGDKVLCEGNTWGDTFWGMDMRNGEGENYLGRLLMELRKQFRNQSA